MSGTASGLLVTKIVTARKIHQGSVVMSTNKFGESTMMTSDGPLSYLAGSTLTPFDYGGTSGLNEQAGYTIPWLSGVESRLQKRVSNHPQYYA